MAQLVECLPSNDSGGGWVWSVVLHKPGMVAYTLIPAFWRWRQENQPHSESEASWGHVWSCFKTTSKQTENLSPGWCAHLQSWCFRGRDRTITIHLRSSGSLCRSQGRLGLCGKTVSNNLNSLHLMMWIVPKIYNEKWISFFCITSKMVCSCLWRRLHHLFLIFASRYCLGLGVVAYAFDPSAWKA